MTRWGVLFVGLALAACGTTAAPTVAGQAIDGTVVLHAQEGVFGESCAGAGGFADIAQGMGLTLRDGEGAILGTARLGRGHAKADRRQCVFDFTFDDVPDADFYALEAGSRGELTYSRDELENQDWTIDLEIGD